MLAVSPGMRPPTADILPSPWAPVEFIENQAGDCWADEKYLNHFLTMHGNSLQIQLLGTVSHFVDRPVLINEIVSFLKRTGCTSLVRMFFLDHDSNDKMYRFMQCASVSILCFQ
jgi:hypothetical protein